MEFREFLEECERREQMSLDEFNLLTIPKFAAGAASNFVTQSGRALGNVVAGSAKSGITSKRVGKAPRKPAFKSEGAHCKPQGP